jgi:hypothetical protein
LIIANLKIKDLAEINIKLISFFDIKIKLALIKAEKPADGPELVREPLNAIL